MKVIALLASYNERRFIGHSLTHLRQQGIESYLIDNCSTDGTVEYAENWLGRGLVGIESFPRGGEGRFRLQSQLVRKEQLARELEADWFIHLDPDEIRLSPTKMQTLAQALETADCEGFNAVNFVEFTFIPTQEEPDHDHANFQHTLRTYYPFAPKYPHRLNAWRATEAVELAWSGGHEVRFPGLRMYPQSFPMKHYLFLSRSHAIEKYVERRFDQAEVDSGWHGWRSELSASDIRLPRQAELRLEQPGRELDSNAPRTRHYIAELDSS